MKTRKKILWLVSWYPNKYDLFDGDFIQRHARAAALYDDIHVLFVKPAEQQETIETERKEAHGVVEQIIYLPVRKGKLGRLKSQLQWQKEFRSAAREIIHAERPDLVHVHIPWKAGLIALWVKRQYKIPYLLTEHWGIYNTVVEDNIHTKSFFVRYLLKKIYRGASLFISVSKFLGNGVNQTLVKKAFYVIPNVVDTKVFKPSADKNERFTFLHVSNMVPLKNVDGILAAFAQFVKSTGRNAHLILIGNRDDKYDAIAKKLGLTKEVVSFRGEVAYSEVAAAMRCAHVLVLNSDIENSPCVIGEALCSGLPIIATNVGGIPELVNRNNGVLIDRNDTHSLARAMEQVYENYPKFRTDEIALNAKQFFALSVIGRNFHELYSGK